MGVTFGFKDLNAHFHSIEGAKLIVNDIPHDENFTDNDLFHNIMTVYESDVIDTTPRCMCPEGQGKSGRVRLGELCPICGSAVKEVHENIDSNVWLRAITVDGETIPFIAPEFWRQLCIVLAGSYKFKFDYVKWLCDPRTEVPENILNSARFRYMEDLRDKVLGGVRSYVHFIANLDAVFKYLIDTTKKKKSEEEIASTAEVLYSIYRHDMDTNGGRGVFTPMLPIVSKHIFVMENSPRGKTANLKSAINISVVKSWLKFCRDMKDRDEQGLAPFNKDKIGVEVVKVLSELAVLNNSYLKDHFYSKPGLIRKHAFGGRVHFSWRSVIVSREGPHDRRDIEMPWATGVTVFHPHLYSRLVKQGLSAREADMLTKRSAIRHNDTIEGLLEDIRKDGPGGKIPVIFHRNSNRVPTYSNVG